MSFDIVTKSKRSYAIFWMRSRLAWSGSDPSRRIARTSATVLSISARASSAGAASAGPASASSAAATSPKRRQPVRRVLFVDVIQVLLLEGRRLLAVRHLPFAVLETSVADENVPVDRLAPVLLDLLVVDRAPVHDVQHAAAVDRGLD